MGNKKINKKWKAKLTESFRPIVHPNIAATSPMIAVKTPIAKMATMNVSQPFI